MKNYIERVKGHIAALPRYSLHPDICDAVSAREVFKILDLVKVTYGATVYDNLQAKIDTPILYPVNQWDLFLSDKLNILLDKFGMKQIKWPWKK